MPQLTTEVVSQGPYTIMTSRKEANTSLMEVQQHTMIIYINLLKLEIHQHSLLTRKVFSLFHSHQHIWSSHHHGVIIIDVAIIIFLLIIEWYYLSLEVSTESTPFHAVCMHSPHPSFDHIYEQAIT